MTATLNIAAGALADDEWAGAPRIPLDVLTQFARSVFEEVGLTPDDAAIAAESTVIADLRGIDSHGVARLPMYARRVRDGLINLEAELVVVRESPSSVAFDARNGMGLVLAPQGMSRCIDKAETTGICLATVRNSNHFGIVGYYALLAAKRGLLGMAMTNASPLVAPTFGAKPMVGTNPLAIAVPTASGQPVLLDMSTSTVAWGKIEIARRANKPIPAGWACDAEGLPTTDPFAARSLTPLGGERSRGGHKGYGLAVIVDVLCGPLAGAAWSAAISGAASGRYTNSGIGHAFMAWRIDAFREPDEFYQDLDAMLAGLRATPPAPGHEATGVLVPGDPENAAEARNRAEGVPIKLAVLAELRILADNLGLAFALEDAINDSPG
ncbi:MAG: Ldh family oxidoreductase [Thermomicrobiales bacterium]